jgi:hypothetical protein
VHFVISYESFFNLENYDDLHKWSCKHRASFWSEVWSLGEIIHSETYENVVDESIPIDQVPKWFSGSKLNFAENLLEKGNNDAIAVIYKGSCIVKIYSLHEVEDTYFYKYGLQSLGGIVLVKSQI